MSGRTYKVATVVGTRPEIIKLSAVIRKMGEHFEHALVHTGQHYDYELSDIFFADFAISPPDVYLGASRGCPATAVGDIISKSYSFFQSSKPDAILIYGDTNSALCAYAAKRLRIPIFHMEAGNRCFDARVPEEVNRKLVDHLSDVNMTISEQARDNLLREGLRPDLTFKIGSSMPEVIQSVTSALTDTWLQRETAIPRIATAEEGYYLVNIHREENVTNTLYMQVLMEVLKALDRPVILPAHPRMRKVFENCASPFVKEKVHLCKPFGFIDYISLQKGAYCVISDSGSIMEEASLLRFPAISIRDSHERPEGIETAGATIASWSVDHILNSIHIARDNLKNVQPTPDYVFGGAVSAKVINIINSYIEPVRKKVWSL